MHHGDVPKPSGMPAVNTDSYYRITLFPNERNIDISSAGPGFHLDAYSGARQGDPSARNLAARTDTLARYRRTHALRAAYGSTRVSSNPWKRQTLCRSLCRCGLWGRASEHGGCKGFTSAYCDLSECFALLASHRKGGGEDLL